VDYEAGGGGEGGAAEGTFDAVGHVGAAMLMLCRLSISKVYCRNGGVIRGTSLPFAGYSRSETDVDRARSRRARTSGVVRARIRCGSSSCRCRIRRGSHLRRRTAGAERCCRCGFGTHCRS